MSDTTLQPVLFNYLKVPLMSAGYLEEDIYYSYANGVKSDENNVVLTIQNYTASTPEARYKYNPDDNPNFIIDESLWYRAVITTSLDFFGQDCMHLASKVQANLYSNEVIEAGQYYKLGFHSITPIVQLGYMMRDKYIPRCTFNVLTHYTYVFENQIGSIGRVTVKGTNVDKDSVLVDETIDEPNFTIPEEV